MGKKRLSEDVEQNINRGLLHRVFCECWWIRLPFETHSCELRCHTGCHPSLVDLVLRYHGWVAVGRKRMTLSSNTRLYGCLARRELRKGRLVKIDNFMKCATFAFRLPVPGCISWLACLVQQTTNAQHAGWHRDQRCKMFVLKWSQYLLAEDIKQQFLVKLAQRNHKQSIHLFISSLIV